MTFLNVVHARAAYLKSVLQYHRQVQTPAVDIEEVFSLLESLGSLAAMSTLTHAGTKDCVSLTTYDAMSRVALAENIGEPLSPELEAVNPP